MSGGQCLPINSAISCKLSSGFVVSCFLLLLLLHLVGQSSGLHLISLTGPVVADLRQDMELDCRFDMGTEELYAVKWYKDDQEFFRYMPHQKPHTLSFPVAGVHLASQGTNCSQDYCKVRLHRLTRQHSGGVYRCEISSEAPAFRLAAGTHNVTVAALPKENPRIEGLTTSYMEGDTVVAKCISDLGNPAPILSWYINGESVPLNAVGEPTSSEPDDVGLVSRSITLRYPVERKLSRGDSIEIRCVSAMPGVPQQPLFTTHTVPLRSPNDPQVINNQKLHWYGGGYSFASPRSRPLHIARLLFAAVAVRWSIGRIFK
ncbi:uncharacterized protein LOC108908984 [Anoplophora glabripennis]|uniref:uncharacterized protein LOC108908984 n=1 Tax=Anoplophora glabripennis TaxID=217634 RepID=UPI0008741473|nr:uncharacterized protein LOC108908984 [Anoplophora glabripennis]